MTSSDLGLIGQAAGAIRGMAYRLGEVEEHEELASKLLMLAHQLVDEGAVKPVTSRR